MKKLTALFISFLLLVFSCVGTSAEVDIDKLKEDFVIYLEETLGRKNQDMMLLNEETIFVENGVLFFEFGSAPFNFGKGCDKIIGNWYFSSIYTMGPGGLALYVQREGKIYDLETAYNAGIITDLSPALKFCNGESLKIHPNGDANGDCALNIRDATAIQKNLAGIETVLIREDVRQVIMDTDKDSNITVRDATVIQKRLAGLEV